MSLTTPLQIQTLQWKLYEKAKRDPGYRFYSLADKIMRGDILAQAYDCAKANGGAPGVDGESFAMIERHGRTDWLNGLERELRTQTYQAKPVRRVMIPKPGGGERPLGIPSIRDRVVQTAAKLLLEPIFEADLEPNVFGYRPGRSALGAVDEVRYLLRSQYTDVVDADLSKYFDTIPHADLLRSISRRITDGYVLRLIKMWLTVPVEERKEGGQRRLSGGQGQKRGTPQGGVISPLLANVYMNRFLKHWRQQGMGEQYRARIVNYADDFVILSRGHASEARDWAQATLERIGLTLNEQKTVIRDARTETFDFLGYTFGLRYWWEGFLYMAAWPSAKSLVRVRGEVSQVLRRGRIEPWPEIREELNSILRGWQSYFCYGTLADAYGALNEHVQRRVRHFLQRRHRRTQGRGTVSWPKETIYGQLGVHWLSRSQRVSLS
ncbi:MAG: group II intron reverse transcriptase/maturase [Acidobacteria bacterium]|nr:group II intron reverse transcriptase/maturase [Bryobacteraceae bacterium CoA2 C42]